MSVDRVPGAPPPGLRAAALLAAVVLAAGTVVPAGARSATASVPDPAERAQESAAGGASAERAAPSPSGLSEAELDDLTARVAAQLRCPVCRNQSVLESSAELSREMQSLIREKLAAGESPEEVKAYFVRSYGEWILLQPEPEGVNLLVYVLPALVLVGGTAVVAWLILRWSRGRAPAVAGAARPPETADGPEPGPRTAPGDAGEPAEPEAEPERRISDEDRAWIEEAVRRG